MKYIGNITYSWDIMHATEVEEFYYKDELPFYGKDKPVKEGDPIGFDVETGEGIELVLFDNVYWNPKYEN